MFLASRARTTTSPTRRHAVVRRASLGRMARRVRHLRPMPRVRSALRACIAAAVRPLHPSIHPSNPKLCTHSFLQTVRGSNYMLAPLRSHSPHLSIRLTYSNSPLVRWAAPSLLHSSPLFAAKLCSPRPSKDVLSSLGKSVYPGARAGRWIDDGRRRSMQDITDAVALTGTHNHKRRSPVAVTRIRTRNHKR